MKTTSTPKQTPDVSNATPEEESIREAQPLGSVPILEIDNLDETVLGYAAVDDPAPQAPEVSEATECITEWDEPADASGTWSPRRGIDDEIPDADLWCKPAWRKRTVSGALPLVRQRIETPCCLIFGYRGMGKLMICYSRHAAME